MKRTGGSKGIKTASDFIALSDAEKTRYVEEEIESKTTAHLLAESRPLNKQERAQWKQLKKMMGRPKIGKGSKIITVSIERDLLKRATQFAKANGLNRSALIARGLETVMRKKAG
jgi:hypothetical protein